MAMRPWDLVIRRLLVTVSSGAGDRHGMVEAKADCTGSGQKG